MQNIEQQKRETFVSSLPGDFLHKQREASNKEDDQSMKQKKTEDFFHLIFCFEQQTIECIEHSLRPFEMFLLMLKAELLPFFAAMQTMVC